MSKLGVIACVLICTISSSTNVHAANSSSGTWICAENDAMARNGIVITKYKVANKSVEDLSESEAWNALLKESSHSELYNILSNDDIGLIAVRNSTWFDQPTKWSGVSLSTIQIDKRSGVYVSLTQEINGPDIKEIRIHKGRCTLTP